MSVAIYMRIIAVLSLTLAGMGCGSEPTEERATGNDASAARSSKIADPCSFMSADEVGTVIGEKVTDARSSDDICTYETEDAMASSVQVEVKQDGADEMQAARSAAGILEGIGSELKGAEGAKGDVGEAITGASSAPAIGDQAFFGSNDQIHVLKGKVYVAVSPPMMKSRMGGGSPLLTSEEKRRMAAAIAQKVASKL